MEVTVQHKKKSVVVLDWGHAPFGLEENIRGRVFIPSGFKVQTVAARRVWIASTRVHEGMTQYKFQLKDDPKTCSDWRKSPSGAFRQANERAKNVHYKKGTNAALICGVSYPNLQREILQRFGSQILESSSSSAPVAQPFPVKLEKDTEEEIFPVPKRTKVEEQPSIPETQLFHAAPIESSHDPAPSSLSHPLDLEPIATTEAPALAASAAVCTLAPQVDAIDKYTLNELDSWLAPHYNPSLKCDPAFASSSFQDNQEVQDLDMLLSGPLDFGEF